MPLDTDYSETTSNEPAAAQEPAKHSKTLTAFSIGLIVGVAIWAATHGNFFITVILLVAALLVGKNRAKG